MSTIVRELSMTDLNEKFFEIINDESCCQEVTNFICDTFIEDAILDVIFEFHYGMKTGLTDLIEGEREDEEPLRIVDSPLCDVFGFSISKKTIDTNCVCPNCERPVSASRFAPHLEKCMGMGRNSSRIASRRIASNTRETSYAGMLSDDDDDVDWSGPSTSTDRRKKKVKNTTTKKTTKSSKSTRCPQHTEDQKRNLRLAVLEPSTPEVSQTAAEEAGSPLDSSPSSSCSSSSRKRDRHRGNSGHKHRRDKYTISPNKD